jgi:hypothetical protein
MDVSVSPPMRLRQGLKLGLLAKQEARIFPAGEVLA